MLVSCHNNNGVDKINFNDAAVAMKRNVTTNYNNKVSRCIA